MGIKITEIEEKVTSAKKNITIKDVYVQELNFVDETGNITDQVISAIPKGIETVSFKITVELPSEELNNSDKK